MPERTTTVWTCSRCGSVEEVRGAEQPKDWVRVAFVNPPKASWNDRTEVGDLCNDELCGGLLVAFVNGAYEETQARVVEMRRMMARAVGE